MKQWEYELIRFQEKPAAAQEEQDIELVAWLNRVGDNGWEVVKLSREPGGHHVALCKRRKQ